MIRENPASRGTETSAEVLVGPPWRMVSNAGQQQWYGGYPLHSRRRPNGSLRPVNRRTRSHPPPQSASEGIGGARGLGNLVRPESHPEPRGFPVQWADPGVKLASKPSSLPVRPRPRTRVATSRSGCSHRFTGRLYPCNVCGVECAMTYRLTDARVCSLRPCCPR